MFKNLSLKFSFFLFFNIFSFEKTYKLNQFILTSDIEKMKRIKISVKDFLNIIKDYEKNIIFLGNDKNHIEYFVKDLVSNLEKSIKYTNTGSEIFVFSKYVNNNGKGKKKENKLAFIFNKKDII